MSGEKAQREARKTVRSGGNGPTKPEATRTAETSDRRLYTVLGAVVVGLAALVWWSLPGDHVPPAATEDAMPAASPDAGPAKATMSTSERSARASAELAVLTERPDDVVRKLATATEIGRRLGVHSCGSACDAVKNFMSDADGFELEVTKTDDLLLPEDALGTLAPRLTPSERESIQTKKRAVMIWARGNAMPDQLPARAAFAAAQALAEALDGFVYDETCRRIETARDFASHTIALPLGQPAFARRQVVIQLYRQEDGTARLLTLGMSRFGSPDISIRGANMASGPVLAEVINAVASQLARGKSASAITVTLDDVAGVIGKKPAELRADSDQARPVRFEAEEPERLEGDPDNEMIELVPTGGASRDGWDEVVASLFGAKPSVTTPADDKELAQVARKARAELPNAIRRFQSGEGELFVKGPFPIPPESRLDGGAATELLWLSAVTCDPRLCTGTLTNEPSYATNLVAGKTVSVPRDETVDWMIRLRDGGTAGGESIKVLRVRAAK